MEKRQAEGVIFADLLTANNHGACCNMIYSWDLVHLHCWYPFQCFFGEVWVLICWLEFNTSTQLEEFPAEFWYLQPLLQSTCTGEAWSCITIIGSGLTSCFFFCQKPVHLVLVPVILVFWGTHANLTVTFLTAKAKIHSFQVPHLYFIPLLFDLLFTDILGW